MAEKKHRNFERLPIYLDKEAQAHLTRITSYYLLTKSRAIRSLIVKEGKKLEEKGLGVTTPPKAL